MVFKLNDVITQKIVNSIYGNSGYQGIVGDDTGTIIADAEATEGRSKEGFSIVIKADGLIMGTFAVGNCNHCLLIYDPVGSTGRNIFYDMADLLNCKINILIKFCQAIRHL